MFPDSRLPSWVAVFCLLAFTIQLIRLSIDLIQRVSFAQNVVTSDDNSDPHKKDTPTTPPTTTPPELAPTATSTNGGSAGGTGEYATLVASTNTTATAPFSSSSQAAALHNYGSVHEKNDEEAPLLMSSAASGLGHSSIPSGTTTAPPRSMTLPVRNAIFATLWSGLALLFGLVWVCGWHSMFPMALLVASAATLVLELWMLTCDWNRQRYGMIQRFFHTCTALTLWSVYAVLVLHQYNDVDSSYPTSTSETTTTPMTGSWVDYLLVGAATINVAGTVLEGWVTSRYVAPIDSSASAAAANQKKNLSWSAIFILVKPYVWPDATDSSAIANRLRAVATWVCVIASKVCGLASPLYLGWASTALAHQDYTKTIRYAILYSVISWLGTTLKEGQSLIYLKVAQAAFVQLSEKAFGHLHSLSLDWHLRKKLGEVLRSMDRGIAACDILMKYLFLWLIPAIAECLVVCIIFATYFKYLPLGVAVFYFVFAYIVWTILLTVWRKKFRKAMVQHDNEWHDRFTDSLINFETVKFFTADQYEMKRFAEAVSRYQAGSVHVQGSLAFLNITQQVLLKICLAMALSLSAIGIQQRIDCCVQTVGCDSGVSECCQNISQVVCPGSK